MHSFYKQGGWVEKVPAAPGLRPSLKNCFPTPPWLLPQSQDVRSIADREEQRQYIEDAIRSQYGIRPNYDIREDLNRSREETLDRLAMCAAQCVLESPSEALKTLYTTEDDEVKRSIWNDPPTQFDYVQACHDAATRTVGSLLNRNALESRFGTMDKANFIQSASVLALGQWLRHSTRQYKDRRDYEAVLSYEFGAYITRAGKHPDGWFGVFGEELQTNQLPPFMPAASAEIRNNVFDYCKAQVGRTEVDIKTIFCVATEEVFANDDNFFEFVKVVQGDVWRKIHQIEGTSQGSEALTKVEKYKGTLDYSLFRLDTLQTSIEKAIAKNKLDQSSLLKMPNQTTVQDIFDLQRKAAKDTYDFHQSLWQTPSEAGRMVSWYYVTIRNDSMTNGWPASLRLAKENRKIFRLEPEWKEHETLAQAIALAKKSSS